MSGAARPVPRGGTARRTASVPAKVVAAAVTANLTLHALDIAGAAVVFIPVEVEALAVAASLT